MPKSISTLIIHPNDPSTSFLDVVYAPIQNKTVITGGRTQNEVRRLIDRHDRIMMMGHGNPKGLFSVGQFKQTFGYIIDHTMINLLKQKSECVYIWCFANEFVRTHNLKGFYSGMFISEVGEANYFDILATQDVVDESNFAFCDILSKHINSPADVIFENVKREYGILAESNPIANYNHKQLYID